MNKMSTLFAVAALLSGVQSAAAQGLSEPMVHLTAAQTQHFQAALDTLAVQGHIAIIAEGVPRKDALKAAEAPVLSDSVSLEEALSQIAKAYDYTVTRKGAVFSLKKRYTDPHDFPSVTLEECRLDTADAVRIMEAFSPNIPHSATTDVPESLCLRFVATLSPQQHQAMQDKTLRVADLSPEQQALVKTLFSYEFVQMPLRKVRMALNELSQASKSALLTANEQGQSGLYLDTTFLFDDDPARLQRNLEPIDGNLPAPGTNGRLLLSPTKPELQADPGATLGQVVSRLNTVAHASGTSIMTVEMPLQDKQVSIAGMDNAAPQNILQALANVYGLRIGVNDAGGPKLARQGVLMPDSLLGLKAAIWHSLPEPYLRAVHYDEATLPKPTAPTLADLRNPIKMKQFMEQNHKSFVRPSQILALSGDLRQEAASRVLTALQPQIKTLPPGGRIPVASLSIPVRGLLGIALMSGAIGDLMTHYGNQYNAMTMRCLANFDQVIVYGNPSENPTQKGKMTHSMYLQGHDPQADQDMILAGEGWNT